MARMEADTDEPLDHHRDAAQGPQLGVEPEHLRAKPQGLVDGVQLRPGQPRGRPVRPAPRRADSPPWCHCRYHTLAA